MCDKNRERFEFNLQVIESIYPGIGHLIRRVSSSQPSEPRETLSLITDFAENELQKHWSSTIELHIIDRFCTSQLAFLLFEQINIAELENPINRRLLLFDDRPRQFCFALEQYDWRTLIQSKCCLLAVDIPQGNILQRILKQYPDISNASFQIYAGDETSTEERQHRIHESFRHYQQAVHHAIADYCSTFSGTKKPPFPKTIRFFVAGHNYLQDACVQAFQKLGYGANRLQWKDPVYRFVRSSAWRYEHRQSKHDTAFFLNTTHRIFTQGDVLQKLPIRSITWFVDNPRRYVMHPSEYEGCDVIGVFDKTYIPCIRPHADQPVIEVRTGFGIDASYVCSRESFSSIDIAFVGELGIKGFLPLEEGLTELSPELVHLANTILKETDILKPINLPMIAEKEFTLRDARYRGAWVEFLENKASSLRRRYYLEALADMGLVIFGDADWEHPSYSGPLRANYGGKRLDYFTELPNLYASAKININIFHSQCVVAPNPRVYDVLACGGFLLTQYNPGLEDEFHIGRELVVFHTRDELRNKAEYFLNHPKERNAIAEQGQLKALAKCGYHDRMQRFLSALT